MNAQNHLGCLPFHLLLNVLARCFGTAPKTDEGLHGYADDCPVLALLEAEQLDIGARANVQTAARGVVGTRRAERHDHRHERRQIEVLCVACALVWQVTPHERRARSALPAARVRIPG